MLDSSKRTIAILTAAACLGAGGLALADSGSSTSTDSHSPATEQTIQTQTTPTTPDSSGDTTADPCADKSAAEPGATQQGSSSDQGSTTSL